MDSFAITLFVVCACAGMLSVALLYRWLQAQTGLQPDITLDSEPAVAPIVSPLPASRAAATRSPPPALPPMLDDEPTQPMTRTDTTFARTDFPSTLPQEALEAAEAAEAADAGPASASAIGFADTMPMPVETLEAR